jgi:hypothetical protein
LLALFKPARLGSLSSSQTRKRPSEGRVEEALVAIERAELLPGFELVKEGVLEQLKDTARTRASIDEDALPPDALIYLLASNVANALLCSGSHHIYRGVLSESGRQLLATFEKASEIMVQFGVHSREERDRDMQILRKEISEVG